MEYFRTFLNEIEFSREFLMMMMMMMMMRKIEKFLHRFFQAFMVPLFLSLEPFAFFPLAAARQKADYRYRVLHGTFNTKLLN